MRDKQALSIKKIDRWGKGWGSQKFFVYYTWRGLGGRGEESNYRENLSKRGQATPLPPKTSYKKLGYRKNLSYIYVLP
jgi:hypothetical protein